MAKWDGGKLGAAEQGKEEEEGRFTDGVWLGPRGRGVDGRGSRGERRTEVRRGRRVRVDGGCGAGGGDGPGSAEERVENKERLRNGGGR